jgi:hypothetical protein
VTPVTDSLLSAAPPPQAKISTAVVARRTKAAPSGSSSPWYGEDRPKVRPACRVPLCRSCLSVVVPFAPPANRRAAACAAQFLGPYSGNTPSYLTGEVRAASHARAAQRVARGAAKRGTAPLFLSSRH